MDAGQLAFLLVVILIAYLPYKIIQRIRWDGLTAFSTGQSLLLTALFCYLSYVLFSKTRFLWLRETPLHLMVFMIVAALWFLSGWVFRRIGVLPKSVIQKNPKWSILRLEPKTLILKFSEVMFQQATFMYLLFVVLRMLPEYERIWWFTCVVGVLHFVNIIFVPSGWPSFFLSIPMAILFGGLILNGYLFISSAVHLGAYVSLVAWFWLRRNYKPR